MKWFIVMLVMQGSGTPQVYVDSTPFNSFSGCEAVRTTFKPTPLGRTVCAGDEVVMEAVAKDMHR